MRILTRQRHTFLYIVSLSLLWCLSACEHHRCADGSHDTITIINNSVTVVNWIADDNPNDSVWTVNGAYGDASEGLISSNSTDDVRPGLEGCWEYYYGGGYSQYYFIFNHDTVQAIGWQGISGTNRGLLKRVKVDLHYLQDSNFTIRYP